MTRRFAAISVWTLSWAFALAAIVLGLVAGLPAEPLPGVFLSPAPDSIRSTFASIGVTVALLYGPVSALLISRRPHPVGVILAIHAVGSGIAAFGVQWGLLGAAVNDLPLWGLFAFAAGWGFVPGTFLTAVLPILVTHRRIPRWQRALVAVGTVIASLAFLASLVQQSVPVPRNPFAVDIPWLQNALIPAYTALSFAAVGLSLISCVVLLGRWTRAVDRERRSIGWLTLGHAFLTLSYAALVLPEKVAVPDWLAGFAIVAPVVGQILYPAAILVVVLGQRLWGVELVVSRIILWLFLTAGGVCVYLLAVLIAPQLVPGAEGLWLSIPLLVALAAHPLRRWLQRRIDLLIYGEGVDAAAVLARLGTRIGELEPDESGLRDLCAALQRVLRLRAVEVRSTRSPLRAAVGAPSGEPVVLPLGASTSGELRVWPPEAQRLDGRTLSVLTDVAGLFAVAVTLIESTISLDAARADLVSRRAQERRRMQRELHDGIGPSLTGIGFGLAAVENLLVTDPHEATTLLRDLSEDLARRAHAVRELAGEVSASPLDGTRLDTALQDLANRFTTPALTVVTQLQVPQDLDISLQEGVYFVAAEAMNNAVRHSGASRVHVSIRAATDAIEVEIFDDGTGIDASHVPGIGLTSMRQRAHVLGGVLRISNTNSGTRVHALLPLAPTARIEDNAL